MRRGVAGLGAAIVLLAGVGTANAPATAAPTVAPPAASGAGLVLVRTTHSLLGIHQWYRQTYHGVPVLDGFYAEHRDTRGRLTSVTDGRVHIFSGGDIASGAGALPIRPLSGAPGGGRAELSIRGGPDSRLVWSVLTSGPAGSTRTLRDAHTGQVLETRRLVVDFTGHGKVFSPNPVVSLKNESLTDHADADSAVPASAYSAVSLTHLDASTKLRGDYAFIDLGAKTASSPTRSFFFTRHDDRFEQVMAYYSVTKAQTYIHTLGFVDVNSEPQKLRPDAIPDDNSFYDPAVDVITFGTGGVDDAEDAEVIWHEYGHAIQDAQVPGFGSGAEAGAIGEGFGDYWALTMSQPVSKGFEVPCLMDWDSTSYTTRTPHCIRRADTGLTMNDRTGEVHHDGQIWSRALYDINKKLGRTPANRIVLESQFSYAPNTTFSAAGKAVVAAAQQLYGSAAATICKDAFLARGVAV